MKQMRGIFPALITPFDADDKISGPVLRQVVRLGLKQGVNGFYVGGSTAEFFSLTIGERKNILETVTDELQAQASVIAHIGCISTSQAIELAKHAQACGADAVSSVVPFYFPFNFEEIKGYYMDILDSCPLPMVIYNIPGLSGVELRTEQIGELISDRRIIGIKHTSKDYFVLERLKNFRDDLLIYNGIDEMFLAGLSMGADGGIGSTYNIMAERFVRIREFYRANDMASALSEQKKVNNIIQALTKVGVIPGVKAILELMGVNAGVCRRPFRPLEIEQREYLYKVFREL